MRARVSARRVLAGLTLAVFSAACSIEAPRIEIIGAGGEQAGAIQTVAGVPQALADGAAVPQAGSGGAVTGPASGSSGASGAVPVGNNGSACIGTKTDTGVSADTIKLGANFAVSGPVSNISGPILKGVQAYFNEINAKGGIFGRRIEFKWYDDGWDAQRGKAYIKRLIEQDRVFALSVVPSSNGLDAARSYLEQVRVPVFGTSGLIESQFESPMQWPVGTSTKSFSRIGLVYGKTLGVRNIAVIWLDLLAGRQAFEAIRAGIKPILGKEPDDVLIAPQGYRVSISEPDFGPVWTRVMEDTRAWQRDHGQPVDGFPDSVTLAIDPTNAIKALQAAENIGFRPKKIWGGGPPLFLDLVWQGSEYAATTGLQAGTSYFPPIAQYASRPAVADYIRTIRKYYGDDVDLNNPYLEGGYAGAALTVEILKRVGPCLTRAGAILAADSITNYSAAGLTPPLTFRKPGVGQGHYGNIFGLIANVTRNHEWAVAHDFIADPTPGAE